MGAIISYFWSLPGRTDDQNPATTLTSRDVYYIQSSWERIKQNITEHGMRIFITLFTKHPQYQQLFPFRNVPLEELPKNKRFQAHCNSLMYAFTSIVDCLEDPELLTESLKKQGVAHRPRGVPDKAYWELRDVLLEIFESAMSQDEVNSWRKILNVGFAIIIEGAHEQK